MTRSRVVRVRAMGVGHVTRRDAERVHDETSGIGPGSSGRRDGVGTGRGTSHNRFRPILDNLDFIGGHCQAIGREHVSEVFTGSDVKFAFICTGEKAVSVESAEYFPDMSFVLGKVV